MRLLNDWFSEQLLTAMGWTLVHSLWQIVLISGLLWIGLKVLKSKSPEFKYRLSLSALALSLCVVLGTFFYELEAFKSSQILSTTSASVQVGIVPAAGSDTTQSSLLWGEVTQLIEAQLPILVNLWFLGAMLFLFKLFGNLSTLRSLRMSSSPSSDFEVEKTFYRLMGKLKLPNSIELRISKAGNSPITFGFLKPVVMIPAGLILHLSPQQLEAILAHELAHIKRHDYLINVIQSSLEVLFFYHPSFWWMSQTIKELRENAADDLAVKAGVAPDVLAYSLAEVLNFAQGPEAELALAAAKKRNPTLQRIKRILGQPAQTYPQNPIISIPMILTLLITLGLAATAGQDAPMPPSPVEPIVTISVPEVIIPVSPVDTTVQETTKKVEVIQEKESKQTKTIVWNSEDGEAMEIDGSSKWEFFSEGEGNVIIMNGDTIKNIGNSIYFFDEEGLDMADFPVLMIPDAPEFEIMEAPEFEMGEFGPVPPFEMGEMPPMIFEFEDMQGAFFALPDTVEMSEEEREEWQAEMERKSEELARKMEEKAKIWEKEMGPKMKEYEEKMKEWQKTWEPKMKEFEEKMKAWQEENEPKMKEFEEKMKAWQHENQPKLDEFQRKVEKWQKENALKLEEMVKKLYEESEAAQKEAEALQKAAKENN